jgi:hypothetical protein
VILTPPRLHQELGFGLGDVDQIAHVGAVGITLNVVEVKVAGL